MNTIEVQMLATPSSLPLGNSSKLDCTHSIVTFRNQALGEIRCVIQNREPWFVGKDVAEALGYKNSRKALLDHVDDEDKGVTKWNTLGGEQEMSIINESGVYALIFSSKLLVAKKFKHWVTKEVLPAIRKRGFYANDFALDYLLEDPENAMKFFKMIRDERKTSQETDLLNFMHNICREVDDPSNYYYKDLLCDNSPQWEKYLASDYKMSLDDFNEMLAKLNFVHKVDGVWTPYSQFFKDGYVIKEILDTKNPDGTYTPKVFISWTQKGRILIYERLRVYGVIPPVYVSCN